MFAIRKIKGQGQPKLMTSPRQSGRTNRPAPCVEGTCSSTKPRLQIHLKENLEPHPSIWTLQQTSKRHGVLHSGARNGQTYSKLISYQQVPFALNFPLIATFITSSPVYCYWLLVSSHCHWIWKTFSGTISSSPGCFPATPRYGVNCIELHHRSQPPIVGSVTRLSDLSRHTYKLSSFGPPLL